MSALWAPREVAQADYEQLREATLAGVPLVAPPRSGSPVAAWRG